MNDDDSTKPCGEREHRQGVQSDEIHVHEYMNKRDDDGLYLLSWAQHTCQLYSTNGYMYCNKIICQINMCMCSQFYH